MEERLRPFTEEEMTCDGDYLVVRRIDVQVREIKSDGFLVYFNDTGDMEWRTWDEMSEGDIPFVKPMTTMVEIQARKSGYRVGRQKVSFFVIKTWPGQRLPGCSMTKSEFDELRRGDMVRNLGGGPVYVVDSKYGDRVTAMNTVDLTNPMEWELVSKAQYAEKEKDDARMD